MHIWSDRRPGFAAGIVPAIRDKNVFDIQSLLPYKTGTLCDLAIHF